METLRQPKGVRAGGQFASATHAEPDMSLVPDTRLTPGPASERRELMGPGTLADRNPAWTAAALKRFLGAPDKLVRNPVYRTAPPMRMYATSRVEEVESTEEWKAWEAGYQQRRDANRRKPAVEKNPTVQVGSGRNGYYPVIRR